MTQAKDRDGRHSSANPRRALWCAVLAQAVADARRGRDREWIGSADFRMVCALAGIDPEGVEASLAAEIERDPAMA